MRQSPRVAQKESPLDNQWAWDFAILKCSRVLRVRIAAARGIHRLGIAATCRRSASAARSAAFTARELDVFTTTARIHLHGRRRSPRIGIPRFQVWIALQFLEQQYAGSDH